MAKIRCNCNNCGKFVWVVPSRIKRSKTINCSNQCRFATDSTNKKKGKYVNCCICGESTYKSPSSLKNNISGDFTCSSQECKNKRLISLRGSSVNTQCSYCGDDLSVPMNQYKSYEDHYCDKQCHIKDTKLYPNTLHLRKRIQQKRRVKQLSTCYIKQRIVANTNLSATDVPDALIAIKRKHIQLKRQIR